MRRSDLGQGERTHKAHAATDQGSSQVAEEPPATARPPPHTITEQHPRADRERRQTVRGVTEEPPGILHPLPQTDAEQQPERDTEHPQTARGSSRSTHKVRKVSNVPRYSQFLANVSLLPPHQILSKEWSRQNDLGQEERRDKAYAAANQGPPQVAEEPPATMHSLPHTITEQQPQTDGERCQTVRGPPQVGKEPPTMMHPPPQTNAEQRVQTDTGHPQILGSSQVSEEPPATVPFPPRSIMEQQPQTDRERRQTVWGPLLPETNAEQQPETDTEHPQTRGSSSQVSEESFATVPSPSRTITEQQPQADRERRPAVRGLSQVPPPSQTNAEQRPQTDTEHPQTAQGSSQISEEPPAAASIEGLETDDIVIAYVIQLPTVRCLT